MCFDKIFFFFLYFFFFIFSFASFLFVFFFFFLFSFLFGDLKNFHNFVSETMTLTFDFLLVNDI